MISLEQDLEQLKKKLDEINFSIADVFTMKEIAEDKGISVQAVQNMFFKNKDKLIENVDYKQSGKVWLLTRKAVDRMWGK